MIQTPDEFVALVRTVFRNAYVYNKPGDPSGVREAAEKLSYIFEKVGMRNRLSDWSKMITT